jgi:streptogramin lyase
MSRHRVHRTDLKFLSNLASVAVLVCGIAGGGLVQAQMLEGRVQAGGSPIAKAAVTLWAAGRDTPRKVAEARTNDDGTFGLRLDGADGGEVLYVVARGGEPKATGTSGANPGVTLLAVLGTTPPKRLTINELTTVASAWTAAQFLSGDVLRGHADGLAIAAGNVRNLVDLETGGLGPAIQDGLNSNVTTTLATFSTLSNLLAGCITRVQADACAKLFAAATPPGGQAPADTLGAAHNIARHPWKEPGRLFALFDSFYPLPKSKRLRAAPFIPYLAYAPGDWTLSLIYAGGGLNSLGGTEIDGEGNAWAADNFLVGSQSSAGRDIGGGLSVLAPNGRPMSPMTFGYRGGGVDEPGFGLAIAADDKVWITSLGGKTISVFDRKTGRALSPPAGYNFEGQLGPMQGIIVTPTGDIWAVDSVKNQVVHYPKGDPARGRLLCREVDGKPTDGSCRVKGPFHLAVDQQDRIWITNGSGDTVTRFPASDPSRAESFKVGLSPKAIAIDSKGNAWVNNGFGDSYWTVLQIAVRTKLGDWWNKLRGVESDPVVELFRNFYQVASKNPHGNVTLLRADGTQAPGSPFDAGKGIKTPWGIAIDGNDNVWVANALGNSIMHLCGARTETCPPGFRTGDPISPPGTGYVGHGLQVLTDVTLDQAGNVWVANNWDLGDACFAEVPAPNTSTRCGGNGFVVFFGLAKPVKPPLIGPVRTP